MWSSFTLTSSEPRAVLVERLRADVNASDGFFRGTVRDHHFEVTRRPGWSERTWPIVVRGRWQQTPEGVIIQISTGPGWWSMILVVAASVYLVGLALSPIGGGIDWFAPCFFTGVIAVLWLTLWITAVIEERRARSALVRILKATESHSA